MSSKFDLDYLPDIRDKNSELYLGGPRPHKYNFLTEEASWQDLQKLFGVVQAGHLTDHVVDLLRQDTFTIPPGHDTLLLKQQGVVIIAYTWIAAAMPLELYYEQ